MGLYDREYLRGDEDRTFGGPRSMVAKLIIVNAVMFVICMLTGDGAQANPLANALSLKANLKPWDFWQLITYGFVHSPQDIWHIVFNMYFLWVFGKDVEDIYGPREFLRFYLTAIVVGGIAFVIDRNVLLPNSAGSVMGASGAVVAVMVLYVMHFPFRQFLLFFVLPVPAWVLGVMFVAIDLRGYFGLGGDSNVAFEVHLAGAAFAFLYRRQGWNLGNLIPERWNPGRWLGRLWTGSPKLKVHHPEEEPQDLSKRVDEILAKISAQGEASLTREERRILEDASRRYQQRRQ